jgi:hypothetical protein
MDVTVVLYSRKVVGLMATILLQAQLASASDEEGIPRSLFLWTTIGTMLHEAIKQFSRQGAGFSTRPKID